MARETDLVYQSIGHLEEIKSLPDLPGLIELVRELTELGAEMVIDAQRAITQLSTLIGQMEHMLWQAGELAVVVAHRGLEDRDRSELIALYTETRRLLADEVDEAER